LKHLSPIGRLDKDSDGLIILSNDGTLTKALTKIDSTVGKTYKVTVRENISDAALQKMATGIVLDKIKTKPAIVKRASRTSFEITLFEGRKHQIRRMCDACQLTIDTLTRTAIGPIKTGTLKSGNSRKLTQEEVASLKI
jgi:pseudouridine synthase